MVGTMLLFANAGQARTNGVGRSLGLAGVGGPGTSGLYVVNLDASRSARGSVLVRRQDGGAAREVPFTDLPAEGSLSLNLGWYSELGEGSFSVQVSADRGVGALVGHQWPAVGRYAHGTPAQPATPVLVPLAMKGHDGASSLLTVQNTSAERVAAVEVAYYEMAASMPARRMQFELPPGVSRTIDPDREPDLRLLPAGYVGAARVKSPQPVAVQALVDIGTSASAVYAFAGVPQEAAASEVYVPIVHAASPWPGTDATDPSATRRDTMMAVMNPGASPVVVALTYRGHAGSCAGQTYHANPVTIPGGRSILYFQGEAAAGQPAGPSPLPDGCSASAMLTAAYGRIAVAVVETVRDAGGQVVGAGGYAGFRAQDGAQLLFSPVYRKRNTERSLTTAVWAMNTSARTAEAQVVFERDGQLVEGCSLCQARIPPRSGHLWWSPEIPELADGQFYRAVVSADQPLVAVVADLPLTSGGASSAYDEALWAMLPIGLASGPGRAAVPLALREAVVVPPTPTPLPTPTGTPPPAADAIWSRVLVQNLDRVAAATWRARLSPHGSSATIPVAEAELAPGGRAVLSLWQRPDLPDGVYSGIAAGDRPLAVVSDLRWPASGRAVAHGWPYAGSELVVPLVAKGYNDRQSLVAIQNTDPSQAAVVQLELHSFRQQAPLVETTLSIPPNDSWLLDLATDPLFRTVANGLVGYFHLRADRPLAAESLLRSSKVPRLAASISGVPLDRLAARLYVPWFRREYLGGTTTITVMNPLPAAVEVGISYLGSSGGCAGFRYTGRTMQVPPGGSVEMSQAASANHNLPSSCAGAAVLTSSGGAIAAIVDDEIQEPTWAGGSVAAYNAPSLADAGLALAVPTFRKSSAVGGTVTGVQVMNVGDSPARARIRFYDAAGHEIDGCGAACETTLRPSDSHLFWLADLAVVPEDSDGYAWLESDGPIVAVVFDQPSFLAPGAVDDGTAYLAPAVGAPGAVPEPSYGPYLPNPAGAAPSPTASPTATAQPTATPQATATEATSRLWLPRLDRAAP